jgi:3-deoxy-D-manno-octulosonic-acid transferase
VPAVEAAATARGLTTERLTRLRADRASRADVIVVDTYGDLRRLYAIATYVFLGGSVVQIGLGLGQNLVEPLVHGMPVFFGPHMRRWRAVTDAMLAIEPRLVVATAADLVAGIRTLAAAPDRVKALRACTETFMEQGRESAGRHVDAIRELAGGRPPR